MRILGIAALAVTLACGHPLDAKRLHGALEDLAAVAAETRLLVSENARVDLPAAYMREQREALVDRARDALVELDRGVADPALEPARRQGAEAGRRLLDTLPRARNADELEPFVQRLQLLAQETAP
jgi:hypothetical protein